MQCQMGGMPGPNQSNKVAMEVQRIERRMQDQSTISECVSRQVSVASYVSSKGARSIGSPSPNGPSISPLDNCQMAKPPVPLSRHLQASVVPYANSEASSVPMSIDSRTRNDTSQCKSRFRCVRVAFLFVVALCHDPCPFARGHRYSGTDFKLSTCHNFSNRYLPEVHSQSVRDFPRNSREANTSVKQISEGKPTPARGGRFKKKKGS